MRVAAVLVALAFALGGCGDDEEEGPLATGTPTATAAPVDRQPALWPEQGTDEEPERVALSFLGEFLGIAEPALSGFKEGEPGAGEIDVFRLGEDGEPLDTVMTTLSMRELEPGRWFVTSAQSADIEIDSPEPLDEVGSAVAVSGRGRGFEGNVVLAIHRAFETEALAQEPVIAGSMADLEPFTASLSFTADPGAELALVATAPGGTETPLGITAFPIRA